MCAPRVIRHTSRRYSDSCHTRVNMGASIFFTAAIIRAFRLARYLYFPPLPRDLADLKPRIVASPMLTRGWQELKYRIDVCHVTRGAHIEHL
jgi:hypothetical protein